jgi:hypothetical protein
MVDKNYNSKEKYKSEVSAGSTKTSAHKTVA